MFNAMEPSQAYLLSTMTIVIVLLAPGSPSLAAWHWNFQYALSHLARGLSSSARREKQGEPCGLVMISSSRPEKEEIFSISLLS